MFQSLVLNFVTDWLAKAAASGLTVLVANGVITGQESQTLSGAIGVGIALLVTAGHKLAANIKAQKAAIPAPPLSGK